MNYIERNRPVHEASQKYIKGESASLIKHLERISLDHTTKHMVESMIMAFKDKNALVTELYEENQKLKEMLKELAK